MSMRMQYANEKKEEEEKKKQNISKTRYEYIKHTIINHHSPYTMVFRQQNF